MRRLTELLERRVDPRPLALLRVAAGSVAVYMVATEYAAKLDLVTNPGALRIPLFSWLPTLPTMSDAAHQALTLGWIALAVALAIGLAGRFPAAVLFLAGVTVMLLEQAMFSNHFTLLVVLCGLLALGRPTAAWSFDALLRGRSEATIPAWPVFLIQLQISTMYAFTAAAKANPEFLGGAVFKGSAREVYGIGLASFGDPAVVAAAGMTVLLEGFLAVALWSPHWRTFAFPLGLGLHSAIILSLVQPKALVGFSVITLASYAVFLRPTPKSRIVVWDSYCQFCRRWVAVFRALDWFGVHDFVGSKESRAFAGTGITREQADVAIQLVERGQRVEGFDAVTRILEMCPLTFLVAPVLRLPPIRAVGRRAYRHVADGRTCAVPADAQTTG